MIDHNGGKDEGDRLGEESGDPGTRRTAETERAEHAERELLQDGTDESILETEGEAAEDYAEQESSYSREAESIPQRGGTPDDEENT